MRDEAGFAPGDVIDGRYRVERVLGRGGMGVVLRAHDAGRGQPVAVKVLGAAMALQDEALARFQREAEVAARVDRHGGVVRVFGAGRHRGRAYIVMELIEGHDLAALFDAGLEPEAVARHVATVARTVDACHAQGVVHRDLKPANVLVRAADGRPLLTDFGLALAADVERLTRTGELMGTPSYMAPEQADEQPREPDPRLDVYALGAILYHGLAGRPPFSGPLVNVLHKLLTQDPPPPSSLRPGVPPPLERICRRAMAKAPAERYPTAAALADDLERWLAGEDVDPSSPAARRRRTARAAAAAAALAILALSLAVVWVAQRRLERDARQRLAAAQLWREQVLAPWILSDRRSALPGAAEHASSLRAARPRLRADEQVRVDELLRWIEPPPPSLAAARHPAEAVYQALGPGPADPQGRARRLSAFAAKGPPDPIVGALEGRLWRAALESRGALSCAAAYLPARPRLEPAARDACDALLRQHVDQAAADVVRRAGEGVLEPEAALKALQALPVLPGTSLEPVLDRVEAALVRRAGERNKERAATLDAFAFDAARGRLAGFAPVTSDLAGLMFARTRAELAGDGPMLLAALRSGELQDDVDRTMSDAGLEELLQARPRSRAAAYLAMRCALRDAALDCDARAACARAVVAPGMDDDLHPRYVGDGHHELGRALTDAVARDRVTRPAAWPELHARAIEAANHLRAGLALEPDNGERFRHAWLLLAWALEQVHGPEVHGLMLERGLEHARREELRWPTGGQERRRWSIARAALLHARAERVDRGDRPEEALALWLEAYAALPADGDFAQTVLGWLVPRLVARGRAAEAVPRVERFVSERIFDDTELACHALKAAVEAGDRARAQRWLKAALAESGEKKGAVEQAARELGLAP